MSLILEALRKSEAERRRGRVPGLHAELPPLAQPPPGVRARWPWLVLVVVAIAATAWFARWRGPAPAAEDAPLATITAEPAAGAMVDAGRPPRVAVDTVRDDGNSDFDPVEPPAPQRLLPAVDAGAAQSLPATDKPGAPLSATDDGAGSRRRPENESPATVTGSSAAARSSPTITPPGPVAVPAPTAPALPPPPPAAPVLAAASGAPLRLSDLSPAQRLELPPLKMSMHMWGPAQAQRFAIIDGTRVNEGDRLGDAVITEITAKAVVLAWRGQRVEVPTR